MPQRSTAPRSPPSLLPHFLVALYGLAIVYASLQPFAPWIAPRAGNAVLPLRAVAAALDALRRRSPTPSPTLPFGFFVALVPRRRPPPGRLSVADRRRRGDVVRDGNAADVRAAARRERRSTSCPTRRAPRSADSRRSPSRARRRRSAACSRCASAGSLPGRIGDLGLALLVIWLAVQVNPGIPLFAIVFDPSAEFGATATPPSRPTATISPPRCVEGAHSAFQLLGVGLFLSLLLRERRFVGGAVLLLIGAALAGQGRRGDVLLKPAAWEHWLSPGVSTGVAAGALLLLAAIWLPRPAQVAVATVALLSSLLTDAARAGPAVRARAAVAVLLVVRPPAPLQRPHAPRAARVARRRERLPVRARRASRTGVAASSGAGAAAVLLSLPA